MVFVVIVTNVVKKGIDLLNVDLLKVGRIIEISSTPKAGKNLMVRRTLCNKGNDEEHVLRRILFKTRYKMARKCCKVIIDSGSSTNLASEDLVINF